MFPLTSEQATVNLVFRTLLGSGIVLLGLPRRDRDGSSPGRSLLPVRSAARVAVRFASGRLSERMPVRGEDDMARLAVAFNDMAEACSARSPTSRSSAGCNGSSPPMSRTNCARR